MKKITAPLIAMFIAIAFAGASPAFAERTPPGSFLQQRVTNSKQLAEQVMSSPAVAKRYSDHFSASKGQVAASFEGLRYKTLTSNYRTRVYFVGRGGKIISETRVFRKGTPVFVNLSGAPVLDGRCGNPFGVELPAAPVTLAKTKKPGLLVEPEPDKTGSAGMVDDNAGANAGTDGGFDPGAMLVEDPTSTSGLVNPELPGGVQLAQVSPELAPIPDPIISEVLAAPTEVFTTGVAGPTVATVAETGTGNIGAVLAGGGGGGLGWLAAIPPLGLLAASGGGGGGGDEAPVIPEPASLLTLASGVGAMGLWYRQSRR